MSKTIEQQANIIWNEIDIKGSWGGSKGLDYIYKDSKTKAVIFCDAEDELFVEDVNHLVELLEERPYNKLD